VLTLMVAGVGAMVAYGDASGTADLELISQGRRVDIEAHLVPGKLVLFDFYADWCMPCRIIKPRIEKLAAGFPDQLAVREVDVIDWDSPVARQYGISVLPHLKLFDADGVLLAEGDAEQVLAALGRRLSGGGSLPEITPNRGRSPISWLVLAGLAVGTVALVRRLVAAGGARPPAPSADLREVADGAGGGSPAVWFAVIDGSLDGPFSLDQLADLRRRKLVDDGSRVRRRGDATWRQLGDIVEDHG